MKFGHVRGTKQEKNGSSDWYRQHEAANLARIEAEDAERALATALATQVGNAVVAMPEAASRIAKAATLVQAGQVWPLTNGNFLVASQSDPTACHLVVRKWAWECDCKHMQMTQSLCSHAIAAQLSVKLGAQYTPSCA